MKRAPIRPHALLDVPRRALPEAVRAFQRVKFDARLGDDLAERALPRLNALLDRGRYVWAHAERRRDETLAEQARALFDELLETLPPRLPQNATRCP